jgi:mRNA-degrading endonuclease toxin of MazEF toxin-antitoxin module
MADERNEIHIEDDSARAGRTTGRMRWVLVISTLIAIVAMSIAWIVPALQQGDAESAELATERVEEMREEDAEDIPAVPEPMQD